MPTRAAVFVALFVASATDALAATVIRAGEWQTVISNGAPLITCLQVDKTLSQISVMGIAGMASVSCITKSTNTKGSVNTFALQCTLPGASVMTLTGTTIATSPDVYTITMHSHTEAVGMDTGEPLGVQDLTMTSVSRRLGSCKPGDHVQP